MDDFIYRLIGVLVIILISWYEIYGRKEIKFKNKLKHYAEDAAQLSGADMGVMYKYFVKEGAKLYRHSSNKGKYVLYLLCSNYGWCDGIKAERASDMKNIEYKQLREHLWIYNFDYHYSNLDDTMSDEIKDVFIYVILRMLDGNIDAFGITRYQALKVLYYCLQRQCNSALLNHIIKYFEREKSPYARSDNRPIVSNMTHNELLDYMSFAFEHSISEIIQMENDINGNT